MPEKSVAELFRRQAVIRLRFDYLPKIQRVLSEIDDQELWWRPNDQSNSIANLLLHLEGNLRQWMVHGLGRQPDCRQRPAEFSARSGLTRTEILALVTQVIDEATALIESLTDEDLTKRHTIQGYWTHGLGAVFHVVEHFSGHVGQIIWIAKSLKSRDLRFYSH